MTGKENPILTTGSRENVPIDFFKPEGSPSNAFSFGSVKGKCMPSESNLLGVSNFSHSQISSTWKDYISTRNPKHRFKLRSEIWNGLIQPHTQHSTFIGKFPTASPPKTSSFIRNTLLMFWFRLDIYMMTLGQGGCQKLCSLTHVICPRRPHKNTNTVHMWTARVFCRVPI